jgi:hypothetical protein
MELGIFWINALCISATRWNLTALVCLEFPPIVSCVLSTEDELHNLTTENTEIYERSEKDRKIYKKHLE